MKKIIRLTESDLARIVKRVIMEQSEKHYDYTQKYSHELYDPNNKHRDGYKYYSDKPDFYSLPAGNVWKHQCTTAEQRDWLEDSKYGIIFHCGDLCDQFGGVCKKNGGFLYTGGDKYDKVLQDMEVSSGLLSDLGLAGLSSATTESLYKKLKKEYCIGNSWNNNGDKPGCFAQKHKK